MFGVCNSRSMWTNTLIYNFSLIWVCYIYIQPLVENDSTWPECFKEPGFSWKYNQSLLSINNYNCFASYMFTFCLWILAMVHESSLVLYRSSCVHTHTGIDWLSYQTYYFEDDKYLCKLFPDLSDSELSENLTIWSVSLTQRILHWLKKMFLIYMEKVQDCVFWFFLCCYNNSV